MPDTATAAQGATTPAAPHGWIILHKSKRGTSWRTFWDNEIHTSEQDAQNAIDRLLADHATMDWLVLPVGVQAGEPIGYIAGYQHPDGRLDIDFSGKPFTLTQARADAAIWNDDNAGEVPQKRVECLVLELREVDADA